MPPPGDTPIISHPGDIPIIIPPKLPQIPSTDVSFTVTNYQIWLGPGLRVPRQTDDGKEVENEWIELSAKIVCTDAKNNSLTFCFLSKAPESHSHKAQVFSGLFR